MRYKVIIAILAAMVMVGCFKEVTKDTNYIFYVLSIENDNINLIMERNICSNGTVATEESACTVPWLIQKDYEIAGGTQWNSLVDNSYFGPITAMNYLYKATKAWDNVPNMVINYKDESYGGLKTTDILTQIINYNNVSVSVNETEEGYINLKARMPMQSELNTAGCVPFKDETCPVWLMDYLVSSGYEKYKLTTNISKIYGYWSISAFENYESWLVDSHGHLDVYDYINFGEGFGVRPVITVPRIKLRKL